jgi:hypothetical protein
VREHRPSFCGLVLRPALGQLLSEIMSDGSTSVDISPLRPSRFRGGDLNPFWEILQEKTSLATAIPYLGKGASRSRDRSHG